ncbi:SGNH/GDSL hydrolase family protein [Halocatena salina]|uniref:GDSL-type esterase/lipase family protein n=1 Tax=Halocatena salina TaxID=2934340 RepID=A0A8U0A7Q4_9EURY|nr:SGNH/GDSL hydrolase family protein [Halocatena salina]UPM45024.1 GDSL-type esterase/lipase family protein [Halocatena salina]
MMTEKYLSISLHNVAETVSAEWAADADRLCRVPATVGAALNETARERVRHPTGSEIRFVPRSETDEIEITLSAIERTQVRTFWGSFQPWEPIEIGPEPKTLELTLPDRLQELPTRGDTGRFDPHVCRIAFERFQAVAVHAVSGNCRPPTADELPDQRYLAYGTSITEGAASSATHMNYVSHVARNCGFDALNFGCSGSAYCESAMADYIATREDWDVATLALSVNMANTGGFSPDEFEGRAEAFVDTIATAHPEKPIACITLFPYFDDVIESGDPAHARAYREALRSIVDDSPHDNLTLIDGSQLLSFSGLTADLLHPGDDGMEIIGRRLSKKLCNI